jgi:uncharacterized protein (DUF983 family)
MIEKINAVIYSMLRNKCPRCHRGDFFEVKNPYNLKKALKMNPKCSVCGQSFEPEPGFYFGGMYASYALSVAVAFSIYLILTFFNIETLYAVIGACVGILLLTPLFFRMGRILWLSLFVGYRQKKK